jgi:hypothetical protein
VVLFVSWSACKRRREKSRRDIASWYIVVHRDSVLPKKVKVNRVEGPLELDLEVDDPDCKSDGGGW